MRDTIDRQAAIDLLEKWSGGHSYLQYDTESAIYEFKKLPSAQRWIPCSERLPEEGGWYIVTVSTEDEYNVYLRWYSKMHGWEWDEQENTIAWMPLPECYRGEKE